MFAVLTLALALAASDRAAAADTFPNIRNEFSRLYEKVQKLRPESTVGGLLKSKSYGDHELLWHLDDEPGGYDVIRIYREKKDSSAFEIAYFRGTHLIPGRNVIRRFYGPVGSGWRNDTVDAETGQYLGSQGAREPNMDARDRQIMRKWGAEE